MNIAMTLSEHAKRLDPDGDIAKIVEILNTQNELLDDAAWVEGNLPTGHRTTVRTDLPKVSWRKLNYGVQPSKSKSKQIDDTCGMLETYSQTDKSLADLNGNSSDFFLSEDKAFLESMNTEFIEAAFYSDTAINPEQILGFSPRFNSLESKNVADFGGVGNGCSSIWIVTWADDTVHFTFPKGSKAGLHYKDLGEVTLTDDAGGMYQGYRGHYKWDMGLVVRDWRYVQRIASIDVENIGDSSLSNALITAINNIPNPGKGKTVIYCNRNVKTALDIQANNKSNVQLKIENWDGKPVTTFWGLPIRRVDSILDTETAIKA